MLNGGIKNIPLGGEILKKIKNYNFKKQYSNILVSVFRAVFLISVGYVVLYPILYMLFKSVIPFSQADDPSVVWVPKGFSLENYKAAFKGIHYAKALFNTLSIQIVSGLIEIIVCAIVAYGFARFNFPEKNILFILVVLTMIVPAQAIVVPSCLNFSRLDFLGVLNLIGKAIGKEIRPNILDTGLTFYIPSFFGVGVRAGLFIFIYRQFFKGLPKELEEAAAIDGAGIWKTIFKIVFPTSGTAFLCVGIFSMIAHWNDYYLSAMYFTDKFPLSLELKQLGETAMNFDGSVVAAANVKNAACILFILPPIIMYLILQKNFIRSIGRTGIVG